MAANLTTHLPITVAQTTTNTTEQTQMYLEAAGQTFPFGAVVNLNASGDVQLWPGTPISSNPVLGVSAQPAFNLGSAGAGAPPSFGSVGAPGSPTTFGTVPNQTSAVNIPAGATFSDGRTNVFQAVTTTVFRGQVDNSAGSVPADYTPVISDIGKQYGVTQSSGDQTFYVDRGKSTVGTNTVVVIVALDPLTMATGSTTTGAVNGNVYFRFVDPTQVES